MQDNIIHPSTPQQRPLGRGLNSLIPKKDPNMPNMGGSAYRPLSDRTRPAAAYFPKTVGKNTNQILYVAPSKIQANPHQPRTNFVEKELSGLRDSIKVHGIIQPLVVTETLGGGYELIAGERRLRAARELGLKQVPVIIRTARELEKLELSLIENIQRHDLNPIEKASAYKRLIDNFSLTHEEAARRLGVSRPVISNSLRLLTLSPEVQKDIAEGRISEGQAKVMLEVKDEKKRQAIHQKVKNADLAISDLKREVDKVKTQSKASRKTKKDPQLLAWEERMQSTLGTKVTIRERGRQGGVIEIEFYSEEELSKIVDAIS